MWTTLVKSIFDELSQVIVIVDGSYEGASGASVAQATVEGVDAGVEVDGDAGAVHEFHGSGAAGGASAGGYDAVPAGGDFLESLALETAELGLAASGKNLGNCHSLLLLDELVKVDELH